MPSFSQKSKDRLATAHPDLRRVFNEVIKDFDIVILCGERDEEEQFELYKKGREFKGGKWLKVGATVTNIDGKTKKSKHNYKPSLAVDAAPYPIDWNDIDRFKKMGEVIKQKAKELGIEISWGGDWVSFKDYPHTELIG